MTAEISKNIMIPFSLFVQTHRPTSMLVFYTEVVESSSELVQGSLHGPSDQIACKLTSLYQIGNSFIPAVGDVSERVGPAAQEGLAGAAQFGNDTRELGFKPTNAVTSGFNTMDPRAVTQTRGLNAILS